MYRIPLPRGSLSPGQVLLYPFPSYLQWWASWMSAHLGAVPQPRLVTRSRPASENGENVIHVDFRRSPPPLPSTGVDERKMLDSSAV